MVPNKLILSILILIAFMTANGQDFKNLDFQEKCDSSRTGLCSWDLSWGAEKSVGPDYIDSRHSLLIQANKENSVGFVEQSSSSVEIRENQILSISALIKSDSVKGKGAGLNIGIYDGEGALIANKDMGGVYSIDWIRGTNVWKEYTISVVVPPETVKVKIGMILYGQGKAWFSDFKVTVTPIEARKPSRLASDFVIAAIDTIAKNSLVRDSIDISSLKEVALKITGHAESYSDCYLAINYLLESLRPFGDHHSFFMSEKEVKNWKSEGSQVSEIILPSHKIIDSIAYLVVPPFHGGNPEQMLEYADSMQIAIQDLYNSNIKGWIIDLRQNTGGNMAPMIAGLGPLFSSDKLGSLIDVNGNPDAWYYKDGLFYGDSDDGWTVSEACKIPQALPIAVLTGNQTGSSGEIVVISFIGNAYTKSFGDKTWGLATGNGSFELVDGSQIFLASTIMADRSGRKYMTSIAPDFTIQNDLGTENDEVIDAAKNWILRMKK